MSRWLPCGEAFIVGDIIRWREAVWKEKRSARGKSRVIGERLVTAEVLRCEDSGWIELTLMQCETTRSEDWLKALPPDIKPGEHLRRRRGPIGKGRAERYQWGGSDGESVRGQLTSKFRRAVQG